MVSRGLNESEMEDLSGVKQPTISKILHRRQEPSIDVLEKLFTVGLGYQLSDILSAADQTAKVLNGYMATPLTGLSDEADATVKTVVGAVRTCCGTERFTTLERFFTDRNIRDLVTDSSLNADGALIPIGGDFDHGFRMALRPDLDRKSVV